MKQVNWIASGLSGVGLLLMALPAWTQEVAPSKTPAIEQSSPADAEETMSQVTSVSQLSDVRPGDWAFEAVRSLVERYGVIDGYPDGTFRGNRSLTRNEFVAVLSTVLGKIETQLLAGASNNTLAQDVITIRRLIAAYGDALNQLRDRLNNLSSRVNTLEQQQFSTTAKLNGQVYYGITNGTNANATIVSRVRLNLLTSFQGNDRLVAQAEAGSASGDAIANAHNQGQNLLGTTGTLADGGGLDAVGATREIRLRKLYYAFRPTENLEVAVGSNLPPSDFIDRNSFANNSGDNFASSFFTNNPLIVQNEIDRFGGSGAAVAWSVQRNVTLRALYAGTDAASPSAGLFRDRYQASLEAEYTVPNQPLVVRLQYTHGEINGSNINAGGLSAEWAIQRRFGVVGVFGRLGLGSYRGFNTVLGQDADLDPKTWAVGLSFQNFLVPGSKAGVAIGQPFITDKLGNATQTNFEAFFGLLLNDRFNFSPSIMVVSNPNNRASPTIVEWSIRLLYAF